MKRMNLTLSGTVCQVPFVHCGLVHVNLTLPMNDQRDTGRAAHEGEAWPS